MYDSLKLRLDITDRVRLLNKFKEVSSHHYGERTSVRRTFGNLTFNETKSGKTSTLTIQGSLMNMFYPNEEPTMEKFRGAVHCLEEILQVSLQEAQVVSLEFGKTFRTEHPPRYYLMSWEKLGRCKKTDFHHSETVLFTTRSWSFQGYDKKKAGKGQGTDNLLRLELKQKKEMVNLLGKPLTLKDLESQEVFDAINRKFERIYTSIQKIPTGYLWDPSDSLTDFKNMLETYGIIYIGPNQLQSQLVTSIPGSDKRKLRRCQDHVRKVIQTPQRVTRSALEAELTRLVLRVKTP